MKKIEGYDDYFITTNGEVISTKGKKRKKLKKILGKDGYFYVSLSKLGKAKKIKNHRLVAETFIDKIVGKNIVNHIDENKQNNNVSNLEWVNKRENLFHGTAYDRMIENQKNIKKIIRISKNRGIKKYRSLRSVEDDGFDRRHVKKVCDKKINYNSHKGYKWEYEEVMQHGTKQIFKNVEEKS